MSKKITVPVALFLALIILIIVGRYVYQWQTVAPTPEQVPVTSSQTPKASPASSVSPTSAKDDAIATCEKDLSAQVKSENTQYEKGTILVSFKTDVTFTQASTVLAHYNLDFQKSATTPDSFSSSHILTAKVLIGSEIKNSCVLKQDALVRSAILNVIFSLHE